MPPPTQKAPNIDKSAAIKLTTPKSSSVICVYPF